MIIGALGDIHGDYDRLVTLLVGARIIENDPVTPEKVRWQAGRSEMPVTSTRCRLAGR